MASDRGESVGWEPAEPDACGHCGKSFVDGDKLPVYGETENIAAFSGKRVKRGLYRTKSGMLINADLNDAGNILRKAIPTAFAGIADYNFLNNMIVKKHNKTYSSNG